jgi:hypothetical protein
LSEAVVTQPIKATSKSCCQKATADSPKIKRCCSNKHIKKEACTADKKEDEVDDSHFALVMLAYKCQGLTWGFWSLPAFQMAVVAPIGSLSSVAERFTIFHLLAVSAFQRVPIPPPRS